MPIRGGECSALRAGDRTMRRAFNDHRFPQQAPPKSGGACCGAPGWSTCRVSRRRATSHSPFSIPSKAGITGAWLLGVSHIFATAVVNEESCTQGRCRKTLYYNILQLIKPEYWEFINLWMWWLREFLIKRIFWNLILFVERFLFSWFFLLKKVGKRLKNLEKEKKG